MGPRIGIIAGSGRFPLQALDIAKSLGYTCVVAGIRGEALPELKIKADAFEWVGTDELFKLLTFFKSQDVRETVLLGKVEPRVLVQKDLQDEELVRLLVRAKDKTPTAVLSSLVDYLAAQGVTVKDPTFLLESFFCPEGVLSRTTPSPGILEDIGFGWPLAKAVADLDIGQTVVVKSRAIVAVEGMEGTDEAIKRAGRLAGEGLTALKTRRTRQDPRIDLPAVGLETIRNLVKIRAAALCVEALGVAFFQKEEALALADEHGLVVMAKSF
ncbi:MAG: UDP-2,3-diacylglucosamine diphosphatase LpxI [Candidatus Aminicenantes bacterium]|nr:UDP-2,3-diacylglucosamine diphosphatase LpxI [Candidatus Aminicenantes bacterium]